MSVSKVSERVSVNKVSDRVSVSKVSVSERARE